MNQGRIEILILQMPVEPPSLLRRVLASIRVDGSESKLVVDSIEQGDIRFHLKIPQGEMSDCKPRQATAMERTVVSPMMLNPPAPVSMTPRQNNPDPGCEMKEPRKSTTQDLIFERLISRSVQCFQGYSFQASW